MNFLLGNKIKRVVDPDKSEERLREQPLHVEMEKNDLPAMIIAGLLVFGVPVLVLGGLIFFFIWLLS